MNATRMVALVVLGLLPSSFAVADTLLVPSEYSTIQAAIDAAMDGDFVLISNGIYAGPGNKDLDFGGRAITVRSASGDPLQCRIDCEGDGRGFYFHSGEGPGSVVEGLMIRNGFVYTPLPGLGRGGGILCESASPTIRSCRITLCVGTEGGGAIYCDNSDAEILSCVLIENEAGGEGGGALACHLGAPFLSGCTLSDNTATVGGGFLNDGGDVQILDCQIQYNSALGDGGGLYLTGDGTTYIRTTPVERNVALGNGGGTYCGAHDLTIAFQSHHRHNNADSGGGIYCAVGSTVDGDSTAITDNSALNDGGGLAIIDGALDLYNWAFDDNTATRGGGIFSAGSGPTNFERLWFERNAATEGGAAFSSHDSPVYVDCFLRDNTADDGGGFYLHQSMARVEFTQFLSNSADAYGGGLYCNGCFGDVIGCRFTENEAYYTGGAVHCHGGEPALWDCELAGNLARSGGAVAFSFGSLGRLIGCSITGNMLDGSSGVGGGILCSENSDPLIANCTIAMNATGVFGDGGGLFSGSGSNPSLANSILWGNDPDEIYAQNSTPNVQYCDVQGGWPGTGNIAADPQFLDPDGADDDPDTYDDNDFRIAAGSPCIDAADNTSVPVDVIDVDQDGDAAEPLPLDRLGWPRFYDDPDTADSGVGPPPVVDMGAFEFQPDPCPWDIDGDGTVNPFDSGAVMARFGCAVGQGDEYCDRADVDDDGKVDPFDSNAVLANFGPCPFGW